jgi:hypothetical protein
VTAIAVCRSRSYQLPRANKSTPVVAPVGLEPTISGVKTQRALPQLQEAMFRRTSEDVRLTDEVKIAR